MFRFLYVIFINLFRTPYMITKMRWYADHPELHSREDCYALAQRCIRIVKRTGWIKTIASGTEHLPSEGGYLLYPNHQGKYDVLGIMYTHERPLSFIIDDSVSHGILIREFTDLVQGGRLHIEDLKQTLVLFKERATQVAEGLRLIIFPEGVYIRGKKNELERFKPGSFKLAKMAKVPIVPVALYDSYQVFNSSHLGPVTTYVDYLEPIPYEAYAGLKTQEIAHIVQERIQAALDSRAAKLKEQQ